MRPSITVCHEFDGRCICLLHELRRRVKQARAEDKRGIHSHGYSLALSSVFKMADLRERSLAQRWHHQTDSRGAVTFRVMASLFSCSQLKARACRNRSFSSALLILSASVGGL
mmetsp:Transcript_14360/g.34020  ORF Transcript_14360/g.34020 Transcript_14360/m.34020 type:complete len:113 (-) Transcript_14360:1330-1668(-)